MVTWVGLLSVLGIIAGICILLFGGLAVLAGGMSDAAGDDAALTRKGCVGVIVGLVLIVAGVWGLVS